MQIEPVAFPDCFEITPLLFVDTRGTFVKDYQASALLEVGIRAPFVESFWTTSTRGVLRGLHFQLPPYDHQKLVRCVRGTIFDVLVDLRADSPSFRQAHVTMLTGDRPKALLVACGVAHGFYTVSDDAIVFYSVTREHRPDHDAGVLWSSVDVAWPDMRPVVSTRDRAFPTVSEFRSPFRLQSAHAL